jgi:hypothetical protein
LITALGWRAIFLINVLIFLIAFFAAVAIVRESTDPQEVDLDVGGVALGVLLMLAITFAFIEADRSGADPPVVIGAAAAAVVLVGLFAAVERRRRSATMLPLSLSRSPAFTVANGAAGT